MGRAKPKAHGAPEDRFFVGKPRGKVVVIEDVTTTGGSLKATLESLTAADIRPVAVLSLTNRMEKRDDGLSVEALITQMGYPFYSMSSAPELLPTMYEKMGPEPEVGRAIEEEFEKYGVQPVRLLK